MYPSNILGRVTGIFECCNLLGTGAGATLFGLTKQFTGSFDHMLVLLLLCQVAACLVVVVGNLCFVSKLVGTAKNTKYDRMPNKDLELDEAAG